MKNYSEDAGVWFLWGCSVPAVIHQRELLLTGGLTCPVNYTCRSSDPSEPVRSGPAGPGCLPPVILWSHSAVFERSFYSPEIFYVPRLTCLSSFKGYQRLFPQDAALGSWPHWPYQTLPLFICNIVTKFLSDPYLVTVESIKSHLTVI